MDDEENTRFYKNVWFWFVIVLIIVLSEFFYYSFIE